MKISFDFDSTLSRGDIQELAFDLISCGHEVYITTSRHQDWNWKGTNIELNKDLYEIADKLGIDFDRVRFTNMEDKVGYLEGFDMHFDDDEYEIDLITRSDKVKCLGILINYKNYKI